MFVGPNRPRCLHGGGVQVATDSKGIKRPVPKQSRQESAAVPRPRAPQAGVVSAETEQEGEAGGLPAESHRVPVLPEVPAYFLLVFHRSPNR